MAIDGGDIAEVVERAEARCARPLLGEVLRDHTMEREPLLEGKDGADRAPPRRSARATTVFAGVVVALAAAAAVVASRGGVGVAPRLGHQHPRSSSGVVDGAADDLALPASSSSSSRVALTREMVDRLNAREDKTWTAAIHPGWARATRADLDLLAGWKPRDGGSGKDRHERDDDDDDPLWTRSPFASTPAAPPGAHRAASRLGGLLDGLVSFGGDRDDDQNATTVAARGAFDPVADGLPELFDARERWPRCARVVGTALDQGKCGSCWAVATAAVLTDRACIATNGALGGGGGGGEFLSASQLLSCGAADGCEGGDERDAFEYAKTHGVVTGGAYGDESTCAPYLFDACQHPCEKSPTPECPSSCVRPKGTRVEDAPAYRVKEIVSCPERDYSCVAKEIATRGPVTSYAGTIWGEFYLYDGRGVFASSGDERVRGENHGGHVVKLIGWGRDEKARGKPATAGGYHWLVVNSWRNWGNDGFGRVAVGDVGLGSTVRTAVMAPPGDAEEKDASS